MTPEKASEQIQSFAREAGFLDCGIAPAEALDEDKPRLQNWLNNGFHAGMSWMENHFEKRSHPARLVPEARSVILVLQNYFPKEKQKHPGAPNISKYAYGRDYHKVMKKKLAVLFDRIQEEIAPSKGRIFVDSAPVMERALARKAGLGWIGKNSLLLSRKYGSFFFIGEIICDLELKYGHPVADYCGSCTRCIDACPTGAIVEDKVVDSNKCISYQTIENRGELPEELREFFNNWVFGCDICQDVCPWNAQSHPHEEPGLEANKKLLELRPEEWHRMNRDQFNTIFEGSAVKRTKYSGLTRNLIFIRK